MKVQKMYYEFKEIFIEVLMKMYSNRQVGASWTIDMSSIEDSCEVIARHWGPIIMDTIFYFDLSMLLIKFKWVSCLEDEAKTSAVPWFNISSAMVCCRSQSLTTQEKLVMIASKTHVISDINLDLLRMCPSVS
jgi:hypothetical protein